jgi:predicted DNA-binding transcriptional regulator AlpA
MTSLEQCDAIKKLAGELPPAELPRLLGSLAEAYAICFSRLMTHPTAPVQAHSDQLLDVEEASRRLGISRNYLYRHSAEFGFTRRIGRAVRFSAQGIERHIQK